jgi:SAM-dependent methyltransferase
MKKIVAGEKCYVCGNYTAFAIQDKATLLREARCEHCNASLRNSDLAREIVRALTGEDKALKEVLYDLSAFRILNTCSSGTIHSVLHRLPGYVASEYFDDVPNGEKRGNVVSADLMNLPFDSESFDLILSEDVFEHIADYERAFKEVRRTLAKGATIFSLFRVMKAGKPLVA